MLLNVPILFIIVLLKMMNFIWQDKKSFVFIRKNKRRMHSKTFKSINKTSDVTLYF